MANDNVVANHEVVDALLQCMHTSHYFSFNIICAESADERLPSLDFLQSTIYFVNRAVISIRNNGRA